MALELIGQRKNCGTMYLIIYSLVRLGTVAPERCLFRLFAGVLTRVTHRTRGAEICGLRTEATLAKYVLTRHPSPNVPYTIYTVLVQEPEDCEMLVIRSAPQRQHVIK